MLATSATAIVLALALGAAPISAPTEEPAQPLVPEPSEPDEPASEPDEPVSEPDDPTGKGDDEPVADTPVADAPVEAPVEDEPAADEGDDPFGDHADDEPFPEEPEPDAADDEPLPDYDPLRDSPQALRARHWVRTGIGIASAGGALLIGAILMGASDPCTRGAGNNCQVGARNRAALVMGIPSALLIGGGATMLGIGLARQRKLAVDLQASRQGFGVTVRGRF